MKYLVYSSAMDSTVVTETLNAAGIYLQKLRGLDAEIAKAESQVTKSSDDAETQLLDNFSSLQELVTKLITDRKQALLDKLASATEDGLEPLYKCQAIIRQKIEDTVTLISLSSSLPEGNERERAKCLEKIQTKSALLGIMPEVPSLREVPDIRFECEDTYKTVITEIISNHGSISKIAPIQIYQMTEKPGAILIEWHIVEFEAVDVQEFLLQKAPGADNTTESAFQSCYKGGDTQCLIRDVKVGEYYSFRVSCRLEGSKDLCRWCAPQTFKTSLPPFSWKENGHYSMSDDCKIAAPLIDSAPLLLSKGPQFKVGYTIEFTILDHDDHIGYLGIITTRNIKKLSSKDIPEGTFVLNSVGEIKVDGLRKSTQLPKFTKNAKIAFVCECMKDDLVIIHIDLSDKRVTYEWNVSKESSLYFAAELPTTAWKVMVE